MKLTLYQPLSNLIRNVSDRLPGNDRQNGGHELKKPIIIVSGLPRSGTSMMMKILEAGGLSPLIDNIRTADEDNPKGYYEFERVKKLRQGDVEWLAGAQGQVVKVIATLLPHLPDSYTYQIIFMRRDMAEILASQRKMLINRGEDPDKMNDAQLRNLFEKHLFEVNRWIDNRPNLKKIEVNYNQMLENPGPHIEQINRFLGKALDVEKMIQVVDPDLYRQRR